MNWITNEHKRLYRKAASAIYQDIKTGGSSLMDTTGNIISIGSEKIKDGIEYIDQTLKDKSSEEGSSGEGSGEEGSGEDGSDEEGSIEEGSSTDEYILSMEKDYPNVLVKLDKKHKYIKKIFIIDLEGNKKLVKGKISSYEYVDKIIHQWFIYQEKEPQTVCKWYPTTELYTEYRNSTPTLIFPIHEILFEFKNNIYAPHQYKS